MPTPADFPFAPLSVHVDQHADGRVDVFVNGVDLAGNILKDSIAIERAPSGTVALTLTLLVDDFQHRSPTLRDHAAVVRMCGGAS